jgi:hypothetical protein
LVEELSQQVDWIVGNDVGDLQQTYIERWHHELHQVVTERHLFDLFLAFVAD